VNRSLSEWRRDLGGLPVQAATPQRACCRARLPGNGFSVQQLSNDRRRSGSRARFYGIAYADYSAAATPTSCFVPLPRQTGAHLESHAAPGSTAGRRTISSFQWMAVSPERGHRHLVTTTSNQELDAMTMAGHRSCSPLVSNGGLSFTSPKRIASRTQTSSDPCARHWLREAPSLRDYNGLPWAEQPATVL
jgi:hypothetical protein